MAYSVWKFYWLNRRPIRLTVYISEGKNGQLPLRISHPVSMTWRAKLLMFLCLSYCLVMKRMVTVSSERSSMKLSIPCQWLHDLVSFSSSNCDCHRIFALFNWPIWEKESTIISDSSPEFAVSRCPVNEYPVTPGAK